MIDIAENNITAWPIHDVDAYQNVFGLQQTNAAAWTISMTMGGDDRARFDPALSQKNLRFTPGVLLCDYTHERFSLCGYHLVYKSVVGFMH